MEKPKAEIDICHYPDFIKCLKRGIYDTLYDRNLITEEQLQELIQLN